MAEVIFGDAGKARNWLSTPKSRFSGETPNAILSTFPRYAPGRGYASSDN
ncbi:MbcA/ParS/Xre antitoxin family protein [Pseudomonas sp. SCA2728.1_7]|nr:MbcA/ParS/Xre antitoxin family protein [Pseudomonas sp. SCA2728.1_7]